MLEFNGIDSIRRLPPRPGKCYCTSMGSQVGAARQSEALEVRLFRRLEELRLTLATAESCSGGLIAHRITNVPGISAWYVGGVVAYSNDIKHAVLGVSEFVLTQHGAVSEPVAREMAEGARLRFGAGVSVAVTGIAGPDGGTAEKPVGLVYLAVSGASGTVARREVFDGNREAVKARTAEKALEMLLEYLG